MSLAQPYKYLNGVIRLNIKTNGYCKTQAEREPLPNNLFLFRQQANISQDKLAEAVDCNRRTIGNIENGTHDPSVQMAYRLANYFKVALPVCFLQAFFA